MTGTSRIDRRGFLRNAGSAALGAAAAGSIAQLTPSALAQEKFPARDINWIIYQAPGGSIDTTARIIQPYLEKHGVKTSLDYVLGAGGRVARTKLHTARPDGYVMMTESAPGAAIDEVIGRAGYKASEFIAIFGWSVVSWQLCVKKDSPIKTLKDLKGKKIGYTNPRSTSQALAVLLLQKAGYKPEDAELVKTGGFGPMLAALELDQIDVAAVTEPLWSKVKDKYRVLVTGAEALPPLDNVVGMTTGEAARTRGDFIRAVIRARRRAVEFMIAHPDEAGDIVAKPFNITPEVARSAVRNLTTSYTQGIPYWGNGQIHLAGMKRIIEVQKSVGAITGEIDLSKMIDTQFLPDDIKTPK